MSVLVFDDTVVTAAAEAVCASIKISGLNSLFFIFSVQNWILTAAIIRAKRAFKVQFARHMVGDKFITKAFKKKLWPLLEEEKSILFLKNSAAC